MRRQLAALLATGALLLAPLMASPAGAAETPSPAPSPTVTSSPSSAPGTSDTGISNTATSDTVTPYVSPLSGGIHQAGEPLSVWVALRNDTSHALAATTVTLRVNTTPLTDRAALAAWLAPASKATTAGTKTVATASIDTVATATTGRTLVRVPADNRVLADLKKPGIYPVQATITGVAQTWTATSVVTVSSEKPSEKTSARTPVAVVVPITAGPTETGLLTADELDALTAPGSRLSAQLNAVTGTNAILAVDPAIPAAIRVLGTAAPDRAQDWLEQLDRLPNERFALQFGDADAAVQTDSGRTTLLEPLPLASYMSAEDFAHTDEPTDEPTPTTGPTPSPTSTANGDEPDFPSQDELLSIGENTREGIVWPVTGTAGPKDVAALGAMTQKDSPLTTLIPSDGTKAGAANGTVGAHGTTGGATAGAARTPVLVYDSAISDALRDASMQDDPALRGSSLAAATANLVLAGHTLGDTPLLVVVDRAATRSALGLSTSLSALDRIPGTTHATLATLQAAPAEPVTVTDASADAARTATFTALEHDEASLTSMSSILTDPTVMTGPERASILQLIGAAWLSDPTAWAGAIAAHEEQTQVTLQAVTLAPSSDVNLAGRSGPLRFGVRNDLAWPVNVTLLARPDNLRLEVQPQTPVVAQAHSTTRVSVPVQARIGNGQVNLDLRLISPTGVRVGAAQHVQVTVHAEWETIGLTVLGVGVAAFFGLGLARTIRARRRRTDAAASARDDDGPTS